MKYHDFYILCIILLLLLLLLLCRKIDNKVILVEGEIYYEVDIIAFRFFLLLFSFESFSHLC